MDHSNETTIICLLRDINGTLKDMNKNLCELKNDIQNNKIDSEVKLSQTDELMKNIFANLPDFLKPGGTNGN